MAPHLHAAPDETYLRWPRAGALAREMLYDECDSYEQLDDGIRWWNVAWLRAACTEQWKPTDDRPYDASLWTVAYKPFGYPERHRYLVEVNTSVQIGGHLIQSNYALSTGVRWKAYSLWGDLIGGNPVRLVLS